MNTATISCRCRLRKFLPAIPARPSQPQPGSAHPPDEEEELLPWLYRIVASTTPPEGQQTERNQRRVASLLQTLFSRMSPEEVKVLEAIELGGDSLGDTAVQLELTPDEARKLHNVARTRFITLLTTIVNPVSLASEG